MKADVDLSAFSSVEELVELLEEQSPEIAERVRECASLDEVRQVLDIQVQLQYQSFRSPGQFCGQGTYTPPEED
jgi:hypothetical protein